MDSGSNAKPGAGDASVEAVGTTEAGASDGVLTAATLGRGEAGAADGTLESQAPAALATKRLRTTDVRP